MKKIKLKDIFSDLFKKLHNETNIFKDIHFIHNKYIRNFYNEMYEINLSLMQNGEGY